jgi:hypothetical protein
MNEMFAADGCSHSCHLFDVSGRSVGVTSNTSQVQRYLRALFGKPKEIQREKELRSQTCR